MGFLDRLLGREDYAPGQYPPPRRAAQRSDDEIAVERYQYLLRTAPPETIEQVHAEAFGRLTPKQRDILFERLTANATAPSERPANAESATLAQAATRAELQHPGSMQRAFDGNGGPSFGSMVGSSILGTVAGYVIGSALVSAFLPDFGAADSSDVGSGSEAGSDASGADASADAAGDVGGEGFGGDFGGGDFGDFGF
ncbi:hypothetical protein BH09ACT3_BH09ACT3_11350 [soil metagenome]